MGDLPHAPAGGVWTAPQHLAAGLAILRRQPWLYTQLTLVFSLPPLAAAWLLVEGPRSGAWASGPSVSDAWGVVQVTPLAALIFVLPWITVAVAPVVVMQAAHAGQRGERIGLVEATRRALPLVPKYVWTNFHTTLMFWLPIGALAVVYAKTPLGEDVPLAGWAAVVAVVALHQHVRTILAPYLALYGDLSGTRAAVQSWRLGGEHFWELLATFLAATLPVGVPLVLLYRAAESISPAAVSSALVVASLQLVWVGIQAIRPLLIPVLHALYADLPRDALVAEAGGRREPEAASLSVR